MKPADYIILGILFLWLLVVVFALCFRRKKGGCGSCHCAGDCSCCSSSEKKNRK